MGRVRLAGVGGLEACGVVGADAGVVAGDLALVELERSERQVDGAGTAGVEVDRHDDLARAAGVDGAVGEGRLEDAGRDHDRGAVAERRALVDEGVGPPGDQRGLGAAGGEGALLGVVLQQPREGARAVEMAGPVVGRDVALDGGRDDARGERLGEEELDVVHPQAEDRRAELGDLGQAGRGEPLARGRGAARRRWGEGRAGADRARGARRRRRGARRGGGRGGRGRRRRPRRGGRRRARRGRGTRRELLAAPPVAVSTTTLPPQAPSAATWTRASAKPGRVPEATWAAA